MASFVVNFRVYWPEKQQKNITKYGIPNLDSTKLDYTPAVHNCDLDIIYATPKLIFI